MMNPLTPKTAPEPHPNRACSSCRAAKVRCLPNPNGNPLSRVCLRCSKTSRTCIFTTPQRRKARKRTDTRVAELEREVQAMRALFNQTVGTTPESKLESMHEEEEDEEEDTDMAFPSTETPSPSKEEISWGQTAKAHDSVFAAPSPQIYTTATFSPDFDVIDRGIISQELAYHLFDSYETHLLPFYPAVQFPPNTSASHIRKTKPTLFLAVIAAAAGREDPHLYSILHTEVVTAYAYRTLMHGEKSLELVQAMILTVLWYHPPGKFAQLKVYEYIHMAGNMAVDIGLGTDPDASSRSRRPRAELDVKAPLDEADIEKRRTILACYMITTAASLGMRRPNMLRMNKWLSECVEVLATHPAASQWDRRLVIWIELFKMTDDIGVSFSFEDPTNMPNLTESRTQIMMTGFEKALEVWKSRLDSDANTDVGLMLQYYHTQLYLHEVGLHDDHPPNKFQPPWSPQKVLSIDIDPNATSHHITSLSLSLSSAQSLLDRILSLPTPIIRSLPTINFLRLAYALLTLIFLHISSKTPASKLGSVISTSSIKLGSYLNAAVDKFTEAVGTEQYRTPATFLGVMMMWQDWFQSQESDEVFVAPTYFPRGDYFWTPIDEKDPVVDLSNNSSEVNSAVGSSDLKLKSASSIPAANFAAMDLNSASNSITTPSSTTPKSFDIQSNTGYSPFQFMDPQGELQNLEAFGGTDIYSGFETEFEEWVPDVMSVQQLQGYIWDGQSGNTGPP